MSGEHDDPPHAALPPGFFGSSFDGFGAAEFFVGELSSRPASTVLVTELSVAAFRRASESGLAAPVGGGGCGCGAVPWIVGVVTPADGGGASGACAAGGASDLIAPPLHAGRVVIAPSVSAARRAS